MFLILKYFIDFFIVFVVFRFLLHCCGLQIDSFPFAQRRPHDAPKPNVYIHSAADNHLHFVVLVIKTTRTSLKRRGVFGQLSSHTHSLNRNDSTFVRVVVALFYIIMFVIIPHYSHQIVINSIATSSICIY